MSQSTPRHQTSPDAAQATLATAAALIELSWRDVDHLRRHIAAAESSLRDAESETTHARLTAQRVPTEGYLIRAAEHIDIIRKQSGAGANLALDIQDNLTTAKTALIQARSTLESPQPQPHPNPAAVALLRARSEEATRLVEGAEPLLRAVHTHLQATADTATRLLNPDLSEEHRTFSIFQVDRGVQVTARSLARADESAGHLDRAMEHSAAAGLRSLTQADALADAARTHTTTSAPSGPRR